MRVIPFLGKQGLRFHGDNDDLTITKIPENFLALRVVLRVILLFLITSINQVPRMPLIFPRDLRMTSQCYWHDIILANIVADVKKSKLCSVLADEVDAITVSNYMFTFDL